MQEQQFYTIGIDIGTTSAKVIAFTEAGVSIAQDSCRLTLIQTEDGGAEQDVQAVYRAVMFVLGNVMKEVAKLNGIVRQVGFSAAMHSVLAVDADGLPLTNALTWMDVRAKQQSDRLWESEEGKEVYTRTGTPIHPMTPLAKLMWLKQTNPQLLEKAQRFVSIKEWIWFQWFGEWQIDESMANATGMYNLNTRNWDEEALQLAGVKVEQLGQIMTTLYRKTNIECNSLLSLGFRNDTAFNIGSTDGVLANLGSGVLEPESMVLTIGTSCAIRTTGADPKTDIQTRSFCYVLDDTHYVLGGPSNSGGIAVESLYRQILSGEGMDPTSEHMREMLEKAAEVDSGDLLCLPYVAGERAPLWNAEAKAAWIGIGMQHTRVHLMRSVVEGVLLNAYWIASSLMNLVGQPKSILASARLLEIDWIGQTAADIFGIPIHYSNEGDASAIGAIWLAEIANGVRDWNDIHVPKQRMEVYHPNIERHKMYQRKFKQFQKYAICMQFDLTNPN